MLKKAKLVLGRLSSALALANTGEMLAYSQKKHFLNSKDID